MFRNAAALRVYLGTALFLLAGLLLTESGPAGAAATAATAATAAAAALLLCRAFASASAATPVPHGRIRTAVRDRQRRTAFLSQRDPDASGRPRPRAPGCLVPTAA
ncbi:DUF6412 domain-containing protein [Streptomyces sp. NPDC059373]